MAIALTTETQEQPVGQKTDDQLMIAYTRGDNSAFDKLYLRYKQPLYSYLYRNSGNVSMVDELFQDVWLRVIASAVRYTNRGRFRSWFFTLAHNCLIDYYRKSEKLSNIASNLEESIENKMTDGKLTEALLANEQIEKSIHLAVLKIPTEQREAFLLKEEAGFSIKEIADIQGVTPEAAKSRLRYAYKKLKHELRDCIQ